MSKRYLIVGPSWVGDMVMAQSLFKRIKAEQPDAYLAVLAPKWSEALLSRMPEVDEAIVMPIGHKQLALRTRWRIAQQIKTKQFDQAIVLPGSLKSALIPWFARIPKCTGFVAEQRYGLLNDIRKLDKTALALNVERFLVLGSADHSLPNSIPTPELNIDQDAQQQVQEKFKISQHQRLLALCPGAEFGPAKQWPAKHFAALAKTQAKMGWQVVLLGSKADQSICAEINRLSGENGIDISGKTSLLEVIDVLSLADYVVSNDSGLMHIAAALHRPLVAIYGSSSPDFTPPSSDNHHIAQKQMSCQPCFKRVCPLGHTDCLHDLHASEVAGHIA